MLKFAATSRTETTYHFSTSNATACHWIYAAKLQL